MFKFLLCCSLCIAFVFAEGVEIEWEAKGVKETKDFYEIKGKCVFTVTVDFAERELRVNTSFDKAIEKFDEGKDWDEIDSENGLWFVSEFKKKLDAGKDVKIDFKIKWRKSDGPERPNGTCEVDDMENVTITLQPLGNETEVEWEAEGVKETKDFYEIKGKCMFTATDDFGEREFYVNASFDKEIEKFEEGKDWDIFDSENGLWFLSEFKKKLYTGKDVKLDFKIKWRKSEGPERPNGTCVVTEAPVNQGNETEVELEAEDVKETKDFYETKGKCLFTATDEFGEREFYVNASFDKEIEKFEEGKDWDIFDSENGLWFLSEFKKKLYTGKDVKLDFKIKWKKSEGPERPIGTCVVTEAPVHPDEGPISASLEWDGDVKEKKKEFEVEGICRYEFSEDYRANTFKVNVTFTDKKIYKFEKRKDWTKIKEKKGKWYVIRYNKPISSTERLSVDLKVKYKKDTGIDIPNGECVANLGRAILPIPTTATPFTTESESPSTTSTTPSSTSPTSTIEPDCGVEVTYRNQFTENGEQKASASCLLLFDAFINTGDFYINVTFDTPTISLNDFGNFERLDVGESGLWYYSKSKFPFNPNQEFSYDFILAWTSDPRPVGSCRASIYCDDVVP